MQNNINNETGAPPLTQAATPAAVDAGLLAPEMRKAETLPPVTDNQTSGGNTAVGSNGAAASASAGSSPPFDLPRVQPANTLPPTESQASLQANRPAAKAETPAGGEYPPRLPPAVAVASCPEEPKRYERMPPPLDIEEFIRDVEERKRGAKTMREIRSLGDFIKEVAQRGVPLGKIYEGLKRKDLVSCSRSRFVELCAELFPDLFGSAGRRNA